MSRKFKLWLAGFTSLLTMMAPILYLAPPAQAAVCTDKGLPCDIGYFTGRFNGTWDDVWFLYLNGIYTYNRTDFFNFMSAALKCNNPGTPGATIGVSINNTGTNASEAVASAFIVLTMLGVPPGPDPNQACVRWNEWQNLVTDYDNAGLVHWDEMMDYQCLTSGMGLDGFTTPDVSYSVECGAARSIVFYDASGSIVYGIKHECGNPSGDQRALPPLTPPSKVDIVKTSDARPNQARGEPFTYYLKVSRNGEQLKSLTINDTLPSEVTYVADPATNIPPPTSVAGQNLSWTFGAGSPQITALNSGGFIDIAFKVVVTPTATIGTFTNTATGTAVDINDAAVPVNPGSTNVSVIAIDLTNKPFFQIKGGDIAVGAGMDLGTNLCTQPSGYPQHDQASIVGWNLGSGNNYDGAGTQQGAFALNHLQAFVTGQGSANAPGGLSFANTGSPDPYAAGGEIYGGKFGSLPCIPDYAKDNTNTSPGSKKLSELLGIAGPNYDLVNGSAPKVIYVPSGDVLVDVNVRYSGTYNNVNDIPSFALILGGGNMYIDPSVSQLDGFYSARPSNSTATNGIIYTCAPSGFGTNAANVLTQNLSASCGNKLVFNGAVSARQIWLLRTFGSLANGQPAEIFNYVPELWMRSPFDASSISGIGGTVDDYDAIISLPPNL